MLETNATKLKELLQQIDEKYDDEKPADKEAVESKSSCMDAEDQD